MADIPQGHTGDHPIFTLWVMDNMQRNVWIYIEFNLCIIMTCYLVMKQVSPWTWLRLCFNIINQLLNRQSIWKPLGKCSFYLINPWKQLFDQSSETILASKKISKFCWNGYLMRSKKISWQPLQNSIIPSSSQNWLLVIFWGLGNKYTYVWRKKYSVYDLDEILKIYVFIFTVFIT